MRTVDVQHAVTAEVGITVDTGSTPTEHKGGEEGKGKVNNYGTRRANLAHKGDITINDRRDRIGQRTKATCRCKRHACARLGTRMRH